MAPCAPLLSGVTWSGRELGEKPTELSALVFYVLRLVSHSWAEYSPCMLSRG